MSGKSPAWLLAAIDQRVAWVEHKFAGMPTHNALLVTPLTEPREGATSEEYERWDHSCDNCGKWCGEEGLLTGHAARILSNGAQLIVHYGSCKACAEK